MTKTSTNSERSNALTSAKEHIRNSEFVLAQTLLQDFVETPPKDTTSADLLESFSHLIRIATELDQQDRVIRYIESVKKIPLETSDDRVKFGYCLYTTGLVWLYRGEDSAKCVEYFKRALEIGEKEKSTDLIFCAKYHLAYHDRDKGRFDDALKMVPELRTLSDLTGLTHNRGLVHSLEGNIYRKKGMYSEAIACLEKSREVFKANRNTYYYHHTLWALGTSYAAIENRAQAEIYLDLAMNEHNSQPQFRRVNILSKMSLAEMYTVLGEYDSAESFYKEIMDLVGNDEGSYFGKRAVRGQALLKIKKGEFENANNLIDELVVQAVKEHKDRDLMRLRLLKAEVLLRTGEANQHDEARAMLQEAVAHYQERGVKRHQSVCLELLSRLDSRSGFPGDALKKINQLVDISLASSFERFYVRAALAKLVLKRKLGETVNAEDLLEIRPHIDKINGQAERVILERFSAESYEQWVSQLRFLNSHAQRYVNEFFEDFHFIPSQSIDIEIDRNSHYVREKHLGEIPFHNKFTLMRILLLLAETPGKEYSKEQLALEIWEQEYNPLRHDNNIYININRLRKLIEPNPRESRYVMNGARGYYFNPAMKVNISTKISDVSPRLQGLVPGKGPDLSL